MELSHSPFPRDYQVPKTAIFCFQLKKKEEERKEKQCIPETLQQKRSQAAQ
jgi:hypothetical protein